MSQHDMDLANQAGAAFRADANNALVALVGKNNGATEPATKFAYMDWPDTTTGLLKMRNSANTGWITIGTLDTANLGLEVAANKDASGGYVGLTGYALNVWNAAKTFMGKIVSVGTNNWTHTLPDRTGTLLDDTDYTALTSGAANDSTARANASSALSGSANDSTARGSANNALSGSFYGGSWVNVTDSRVMGTVYTNSTGHQIQLSIDATNGSLPSFQVRPNGGAAWITLGRCLATGTMFNPVIPAGWDYWYNLTGGVITSWSETS